MLGQIGVAGGRLLDGRKRGLIVAGTIGLQDLLLDQGGFALAGLGDSRSLAWAVASQSPEVILASGSSRFMGCPIQAILPSLTTNAVGIPFSSAAFNHVLAIAPSISFPFSGTASSATE